MTTRAEHIERTLISIMTDDANAPDDRIQAAHAMMSFCGHLDAIERTEAVPTKLTTEQFDALAAWVEANARYEVEKVMRRERSGHTPRTDLDTHRRRLHRRTMRMLQVFKVGEDD